MNRRLYRVFGGDLASRQQSAFKAVRQIAILIAHPQRLREDGPEAEALQA